jgi:penicillin-binding protein 1C
LVRRRAVWLTLLGVGAFALFSARYPEERLGFESLASTRVLDADGELLYEIRGEGGGYATPVELDDVAPALVRATLSSEDASFYDHPGVDPAGVVRALWLNVRAGQAQYGGSTITQQLAKLLDAQPRTLGGKLVEAWDAWRLERTLDKDEILAQYLNRAYYGRNAYGVEAASQRFFGKPASDLSLGEASLLAILPRRPTAYDPERFPEDALRRRAHVLSHMASRGWISREEADAAAAEPIALVDPRRDPPMRHFIDALLTSDEIARARDEGRAVVSTAIDGALQSRLEARARAHLLSVEDRAVSQVGIVVLDNETASVVAMVGSREYGEARVDGSVNATLARRHPGSALKPFVYALALERGESPSSRVLDAPVDFAGYRPRAIAETHLGWVSYREALGSSLNVPAIRLTNELGVEEVARLMQDVGLDGADARAGLPIALGAVEVRLIDLAEAYATLARGGVHLEARLTDGVERAPRRVLDEGTAYLVTDMLADAGARRLGFGFETPYDFSFDVAVKSGTSQSFCDNVVVGYTPEVTVAVWVGNFDGAPMHGVLSIEGAAPLFRDAMLAAMDGRPRARFERPGGLREVSICVDTGLVATPACARVRTELVAAAAAERLGETSTAARPLDDGLRITAPADGARIVRDALLPAEMQRIRLEAETDAPRVRFLLDGELVAEVAAPYRTSIPLVPGVHRLRAVAVGARHTPSDEITLTVE